MKTKSEFLPLLLIAAISFSMIAPQAQAMEPRRNLKIVILNATNQPIEICSQQFTSCSLILPQKIYLDLVDAGKRPADFFDFFMGQVGVKACGKKFSLSEMITSPSLKTEWWNRYTYQMAITEERYVSACADVKPVD